MSLKTITLAASKGGVGKTTLTAALAVQAMADGRKGSRVALLDWEPQGSLTFWWNRRGKPANPHLIEGAPDPSDAKELAEQFDYLFVDTPPSGIDPIARAIIAADFVVIPTHASLFDLAAVRSAAELCQEWHKPFAFLINEYDPNRRGLNDSAVKLLGTLGGSILKPAVHERNAYVAALNFGKAGQEHPDKRQRDPAAAEIAAVWDEIKALMRKSARKSEAVS